MLLSFVGGLLALCSFNVKRKRLFRIRLFSYGQASFALPHHKPSPAPPLKKKKKLHPPPHPNTRCCNPIWSTAINRLLCFTVTLRFVGSFVSRTTVISVIKRGVCEGKIGKWRFFLCAGPLPSPVSLWGRPRPPPRWLHTTAHRLLMWLLSPSQTLSVSANLRRRWRNTIAKGSWQRMSFLTIRKFFEKIKRKKI